MKAKPLRLTCIALIASFGLNGCEDKESQVQLDELRKDLESAREKYESLEERHESEEEKNDELSDKNRELTREVKTLTRRAESAERDFERLKAREEKAREEKLAKGREPSSREKLAAAKKVAASHLSAIVTIKGDQSSGAGTLVSKDGKSWIYLPASAVIGNSRLEVSTKDGTRLDKFGAFELAVDAGLARLELKAEIENTLTPVEPSNPESGAWVLAVGESDALLEGRVYESNATSLNVGSRFTGSAAGTPAFSGETGELLGIIVVPPAAGHELWPRQTEVRKNFEICRLDREVEWSPVPITTFMEEAKTIAEADRLTRLILAFAATTPSSTGIGMSSRAGGTMTAVQVLEEHRKVAVVAALFELDEWLTEKGGRAAKADLERRIGGVYGDIQRIASRSTKKFAAARFSPYHAKIAAQSLEWRKDAEKKLAETAKDSE